MKKLVYLILISIMIFVLTSCESETEKNKKQIVGEWEIKTPFINKNITLEKDGTFEIKVFITEEDSDMVVNRGEIKGNWDLIENKFSLKFSSISKTIEKELDWKIDKQVLYDFNSVALKKMKFTLNDKKIEWKRLVDPITNEKIDSKDVFIDLKPVAVNLFKDRIRGKERFLCLHYKLSFEDIEGIEYIIKSKKEEFAKISYELHPRIRDSVIMYLSSLKFRDVKTFAKSNKMNKELKKVLNHYLNKKLKTLEIERIIVASSKEGVNDFMGFDEEDDENDSEKEKSE